jgi:hypothetical protein
MMFVFVFEEQGMDLRRIHELEIRSNQARMQLNQETNSQMPNLTRNESNVDVLTASNHSLQMQIPQFAAI